MRFDMLKKAAIAPMSQMSDCVKPWRSRAAKSAGSMDAESRATFTAKSMIARSRGVRSAWRWFALTWSAISGFFDRTRSAAPWATVQYVHALTALTATTIISRSARERPDSPRIRTS